MSHEHHADVTTGDRLYETFFSAAFGGTVIAFFFLIVDAVGGRALRTPSVAGQMLFFGEDPAEVTVPDLAAVSLMTVAHLAAFLVAGYVASILVRRVEEATGGSFIISAIAVFVLLEVPAFLVSGVIRPDLGAEIGQGLIAIANVLAALAMTGILRRAHTTAQEEA